MSELAPPQILVVDDDAIVRQLICDILRSHGADVSVAGDGKEALTVASCAAFDLCVLDIHMPHMDGLEACARMRAATHTAALPILFLTMNSDTETVARAFAAGGNDFLSKPVNAALLWHRAHILIESARAGKDVQRLKSALDCMKEK
jgi:two-component system NtrC family sensor kinase